MLRHMLHYFSKTLQAKPGKMPHVTHVTPFFKKNIYILIYSFLKNGVTCVTCRVLLEFPYKTGVTCAVTCGRNMCNLSNILSFSVGKK